MTNGLARGALLLSISLATVGAIATGATGQRSSSSGEGPVLGSAPYVPTADGMAVPLRSARLDNEGPQSVVQPVSIRVAEIGLEAPVISVGVDDNNQLDVPAADTVGWYQYSARPGEQGASVLAAHVDYGGVPGAFFNLEAVVPGETLDVVLSDGSVLSYVVVGNTEYDKSELPAEELFRKDGEPVLQLITCGGTFDPDARSYVANVVVTAVPLSA